MSKKKYSIDTLYEKVKKGEIRPSRFSYADDDDDEILSKKPSANAATNKHNTYYGNNSYYRAGTSNYRQYGQSGSGYSGFSQLYSKYNFFKKSDLIKPHMHYIDEWKVKDIVKQDVNNENVVKSIFEKFAQHSSYKKLGKKPDLSDYCKKFRENFSKIPEHMYYDIHKMYYHKMDNLTFEPRTEKNNGKFKFLEKANNPVGKIISEGSNLKSSIFAKNSILYYLASMTAMDYVDDQNQGGKGLSGDSDSNIDKDIDNMLNNNYSKQIYDDLMNQAQESCQAIDNILDKELQDKMFDEPNNDLTDNKSRAAKFSPEYFRQIQAKIENITLNVSSFKNQIKKILDKTTTYFSSKETVVYDDLLNTQDISGLDDYILLHPKLRKIMAEDILIRDVQKCGKIDVYLDVSGSMTSSSGIQKDNNGGSLRKIDFVKALTAKLKQMDMLNNVYIFDTRLKKISSNIIVIASIDASGGTNLDAPVRNIINEGINGLIITDAEDNCSIYSEKAFFVGCKGADFSCFDNDTLEQYAQSDQLIVYDGVKVQKVDKNGRAI